MRESESQNGRRATAFRLIVGSACTGLVVTVFVHPELAGWSYASNWLAASIFFSLAFLARLFSFEAPEHRVRITLDTPVYLASVLTVGEVMGGLACYLSLITFLGWRHLYAGVIQRDRSTAPIERVATILFAPGMCAAVLMGLVWLFDFTVSGSSNGSLYRFALLFGFVFVVVQYSLTGVYYVLRGVPWRRFLGGVLLPGLVTEMALVPIAILMVLVYDGDDLSPFMLLGVIFLFVNYVLRNLSDASAQLGRQVRELAALNRLGQSISASLERPELVTRIAQETLEFFEGATAVFLDWVDETGTAHLDVVDRKGDRPANFPAEAARQFSSQLTTNPQDNQALDLAGTWVGVPIANKGACSGVLGLWSPDGSMADEDPMRFLRVIAQQAGIALENARLYELATVDSLTGLYVRRYFNDRLRDEVARVGRYDGRFSLCLLDVDFLKRINDTHGHGAGDEALRHVAEVMRRGTRNVDTPARLGGDEFAILLPNLDIHTAQMVAERLRGLVAATPFEAEGVKVRVTVSIGVVSFPGQGVEDVTDLVRLADQALYRAKTGPDRNRVETHDPALAPADD